MSAPRHILIVDGDATSRNELAREVARLGYTASHVATADGAGQALERAARTDLILVECELPDGDGRDLVARLRRRGLTMPIMLLADAATEEDMVRGLDAGGDDFMVRPLRPREFAARIRAQFRVSINRDDVDLRVGALTFRPSTRTAFQPFLAAPVRLTEKEASLLARLCRAEGRPVSRETLLREVWGYSPNVSSHTVETHIYRLRRKIEAGGDTPQMVLNDDRGYRLAVPEPLDSSQDADARPEWGAGHSTNVAHPPPRVLAAAIR